jgi:hypothetical protein
LYHIDPESRCSSFSALSLKKGELEGPLFQGDFRILKVINSNHSPGELELFLPSFLGFFLELSLSPKYPLQTHSDLTTEQHSTGQHLPVMVFPDILAEPFALQMHPNGFKFN